jgi:hypothetical protein
VDDTQVQGLAFLDDHRLAVAPDEGGIRGLDGHLALARQAK